MRRVFLILVLIMLGLSFACSRKPKTSCVYGNKIPMDILDPVVQLGDSLITALENQEYDRIYDRAGELMRKAQTREQFKLMIQEVVNSFGPFEFSQLREAYYLTNKAGKKFPVVTVPCNLEMENANDLYQAPANSEMVSLIYSSMGREESAHILLELIKEGGSWKLFSIVPGLETVKGKNVEDYINLALKAREQNKPKLALLYYKIAFLLADYSPNVMEFVAIKIGQLMNQVKTDYMPTGIPQIWTTEDGSHFEVYNVDVFLEKGEPWVKVEWTAESFADPAKLEASSEKLLDFALTKFSETQEFFVGIMVIAYPKDMRQVSQTYRKFRKFSEVNP